jgi:hypothetical protein
MLSQIAQDGMATADWALLKSRGGVAQLSKRSVGKVSLACIARLHHPADNDEPTILFDSMLRHR